MGFFLFAAGAAVGSFLKVVADRYNPNSFLFHRTIIGGRSHCPDCGTKLRWFELVPVMSYLWQRGKCRTCGHLIDWQCPAAEIVSGLLFVFVLLVLKNYYPPSPTYYLLSTLWIFVFSILLLMTLIDFRLRIIPDEIHILLLLAGIGVMLVSPFGRFEGSFLGTYADLFGFRQNVWVNHILAAAVAGALFGLFVFASRGRAMGGGDFKLAAVLGFLFGWPDIVVIIALSFIIGACVGVVMILSQKGHLKSTIAFGPFLAIGSFIVFLFGQPIMQFYFGLLR